VSVAFAQTRAQSEKHKCGVMLARAVRLGPPSCCLATGLFDVDPLIR